MKLAIIINNSSMQPIYEQILDQIKARILHGELQLEQEGFIITVHGKGSFVACTNQVLMQEELKKDVEADLELAIQKGRSCGMSNQDLSDLFHLILEES